MYTIEDLKSVNFMEVRATLLYSPRPSVIEAATALVAATEDNNVITGLSSQDELERVVRLIQEVGESARDNLQKQIIIVAGSPGSGKTLIGLRIAHDRAIQSLLPESMGTPLYLTGNAPLVEVLVESLARDEVRRRRVSKREAILNADAKIRLVHGITENKLGIESNVIVFDEGQRIWTAKHMRRKKADPNVGSEAEEVLSYLETRQWALVVVLLGEGQEINTGEEGVVTWLEAVKNRNLEANANWQVMTPFIGSDFSSRFSIVIREELRLRVVQRTDSAADVSSWVAELLDFNREAASSTRKGFSDYPIYITRDLSVAKVWLRNQSVQFGGTCGLLASSKSKRLFRFGLDVVSEASRSFPWKNWYLNKLPDLNSSEALEVVATEYKCQGLELDWAGVCWSWDLVVGLNAWKTRNLNISSGAWSDSTANSNFHKNSYRVLLTRSRKGMIIWIPKGVVGDRSMSASEMDKVADFLNTCGAEYL